MSIYIYIQHIVIALSSSAVCEKLMAAKTSRKTKRKINSRKNKLFFGTHKVVLQKNNASKRCNQNGKQWFDVICGVLPWRILGKIVDSCLKIEGYTRYTLLFKVEIMIQ